MFPLFYLLLRKESTFPLAFKTMRFWAFLLLIFGIAPLKIKGKENIPDDGTFIICPNHSSFFDIFCIYAIFPKYFTFTGKKEIEKWPLFHIFYTSGMNILVDRKNPKGDIKAFKRMIKEIDKGHPLVMFPEGTISKQAPKLTEFQSGPFNIAIQKHVPILPVTFLTNWKLLQRKGIWKGIARPGFAEVIIHPLVQTQNLTKKNTEQLLQSVKDIINEPIDTRYFKKQIKYL